jgi:hypothetical protein
LLHADGLNCQKLNTSLTTAWPAYETKTKATYKDFLARLATLFGTGATMELKDAMNACDYLSWSYYQDIDLTFSYLQTDLDSCNNLANSYYNYVLDVDESLGYLGANQYLHKLLDQLKTITGHINFRESFFF